MIRVGHVILDVDGTLVDFDTALRAALEATAGALSERLGTLVTPGGLRAARERVAAEPAWRGRRLREIRDESFRRVIAQAGGDGAGNVGALVAEALGVYYEARDSALRPYPEVEAAVEALLGRGFTLVAASNGNAALERLPVFRGFAHLHFAETAGVSKPDPRFFEGALAQSGGRAGSAVSVGDRFENDYAPARALGMHAVLLDRSGSASDAALVRIRTLADLPGLLEAAG